MKHSLSTALLAGGLILGLVTAGPVFSDAKDAERPAPAGTSAREEDHADAHDEHAHENEGETDGHDHEEAHEAGVLEMDAARRAALGIRTARVAARELAEVVQAPAEVRMNAYRSSVITPRIQAQVTARHARLGDRVDAGTPLVTLSSVALAEAQARLIQADQEWRRVRELGRKVVSQKRYVAAQVARQQAFAEVLAYGMREAEVRKLLAAGDARLATGRFSLASPQDGVVIRDDFVLGELIEPGRPLFEITDESELWVEARLRPEQAVHVKLGVPVQVSRDGEDWIEGRVIQIHHRVDEETRTLAVRVAIRNPGDRLHPGDYVEALIPVEALQARVAVPERAVVLMQGSPVVFRVEGDALHPQPVETGRTIAGWTEIVAGLAEGEEIVVQGAFFLKSMLLKSQMGEGHAH